MPQGPQPCKARFTRQFGWFLPDFQSLTGSADEPKLTILFMKRSRAPLMPNSPANKGPTKSEAARARSAAALRENLKRRKIQARQHAETTSETSDDEGARQAQSRDQTQ